VKKFNVALLGKWRWRLRTEEGGLWSQVLAYKYGVSSGFVVEGGRTTLGWWKDIFSKITIITSPSYQFSSGSKNLYSLKHY
jgi:hypothetical protein